MLNENTATEGGTKRGKVNQDGNIAKGGIGTLVVGAVSTAAIGIVTAIKHDKGKTILKIGKLILKWKS